MILIRPIFSNQNQYESMKKKTTSSRMRGYFISLYLLISVFLVMEGTLFPLYAADYRGSENEQRVATAQTVKEVFSYMMLYE